jgi:hypothetical protein
VGRTIHLIVDIILCLYLLRLKRSFWSLLYSFLIVTEEPCGHDHVGNLTGWLLIIFLYLKKKDIINFNCEKEKNSCCKCDDWHDGSCCWMSSYELNSRFSGDCWWRRSRCWRVKTLIIFSGAQCSDVCWHSVQHGAFVSPFHWKCTSSTFGSSKGSRWLLEMMCLNGLISILFSRSVCLLSTVKRFESTVLLFGGSDEGTSPGVQAC